MKKDEEDGVNPLANVTKSHVLHESKIFNATPLDIRQCCDVLTQVLFLLHQGETFTSEEATGLFFGVTKLFQSKDFTLRRLIYLAIKELAHNEDEAFIVISSLEKDINGNVDLFRANAIRVLSKILDATMIEQRERYLRQAIVSKDPLVQSSAAVAGIRLFKKSPEVIRRWLNEVQEAVKTEDDMVSFHGLQLLYLIKSHDKRAIAKVLMSLSKRPPSSPFAQCLLIRYTFKMLNSYEKHPQELLESLKRYINNKSMQVQLEAAKALCSLKNVSEKTVEDAIESLTEMLNSHLAVERFAAMRVLSLVVDRYPLIVGARADRDLEILATDSNPNIAVLAITTLLKTGVESSIDRLFVTIETFMQTISDELKVVLVNAIKTLCLKFHKKYDVLMSFLSKALRDEGGFEYKKTIVDSMLILMREIPQAQANGLEHLCEFIEDCEYSNLVIKILYVLGEIGPIISKPARYIRFIYNRILLELPQVRAVAISALTKFGEKVPNLRNDILVLLKRCLTDDDDVVRDRATISVTQLNKLENDYSGVENDYDLEDLEHSVERYLANGCFQKTFCSDMIKESSKKNVKKQKEEEDSEQELIAPTIKLDEDYLQVLKKIPVFGSYGNIFKSSSAVSLTEDEAEYQVAVIKHIFNNYIIFQFIIQNTMEDVVLCGVSVELDYDEDLFEEGISISCESIKKDEVKHVYVALQFDQATLLSDIESGSVEMDAVLKFVVKEGSDEDLEFEEGYEDEYELNSVDLELKDFVKGLPSLNKAQFKKEFMAIPNVNQSKKKFNLSMPDLQTAVKEVVDRLGLSGVEASDSVTDDADEAMVDLAGIHITGAKIYSRAKFNQISDKHDKPRTLMQICLTSLSKQLSKGLLGSIT